MTSLSPYVYDCADCYISSTALCCNSDVAAFTDRIDWSENRPFCFSRFRFRRKAKKLLVSFSKRFITQFSMLFFPRTASFSEWLRTSVPTSILPARRYASAVLTGNYSLMSVCLSVFLSHFGIPSKLLVHSCLRTQLL